MGISSGLLTVVTWAALSTAAGAQTKPAVVFGKAGALATLTVLIFAAFAWLIGDAAEYVTPLLMLGYLVLVNFNFGEFSRVAAKPAPAACSHQHLAWISERYRLSPREREVLPLLANGHSAPYIAEILFITHNSVKTHIRHIYTKLGIHKRDELIVLINGFEE